MYFNKHWQLWQLWRGPQSIVSQLPLHYSSQCSWFVCFLHLLPQSELLLLPSSSLLAMLTKFVFNVSVSVIFLSLLFCILTTCLCMPAFYFLHQVVLFVLYNITLMEFIPVYLLLMLGSLHSLHFGYVYLYLHVIQWFIYTCLPYRCGLCHHIHNALLVTTIMCMIGLHYIPMCVITDVYIDCYIV